MLTEKQKAFCDYYIETLNATESYKRAYPNITKQRTAESAGNRLLSNVEVKNYIDNKLKEMQSNRIAKAEEVLEYLDSVIHEDIVRQAFSNLRRNYRAWSRRHNK